MSSSHDRRRSSASDPSPAPKQTFHKESVLHSLSSNLVDGVMGAAHVSSGGQPGLHSVEAHLRASMSEGDRDVELEGQRKQVLADVLELFCSRPTVEIFKRSWNKDAIFEDPLTKCFGYAEYAPQWFAMPKAFPKSVTLHYRVLTSTHNPNRIIYEQTQEYTIRVLGRKKVMESMVVIELDDDEKIIKLQDKWNAEEPKGFMFLRRLNARVLPWMVSVPSLED